MPNLSFTASVSNEDAPRLYPGWDRSSVVLTTREISTSIVLTSRSSTSTCQFSRQRFARTATDRSATVALQAPDRPARSGPLPPSTGTSLTFPATLSRSSCSARGVPYMDAVSTGAIPRNWSGCILNEAPGA